MTMKKPDSFPLVTWDNQSLELSSLHGKVLLIFNSALHCSFTDNYRILERYYCEYRKLGVEFLDFPCDQFGGETPEEDQEIADYLQKAYSPSFLRFRKGDVKGPDAQPLFSYLCSVLKFKGFDKAHPLAGTLAMKCLKENPLWEKDNSVKWNFTFFLINRDGIPVKRFEPTANLKDIMKAIEHLIDKEPYLG
jgi:glutathione peroxidase